MLNEVECQVGILYRLANRCHPFVQLLPIHSENGNCFGTEIATNGRSMMNVSPCYDRVTSDVYCDEKWVKVNLDGRLMDCIFKAFTFLQKLET